MSNGSRSAEVLAVQGHKVDLLWDNGRSQSLSDSEIQAYGYRSLASPACTQVLTAPETDAETEPLKWLDAEFEQSIELATEYLGPEQAKKSANQVMQAVRDLGGLPVGILAIRECDRDELLQLQEIVNKFLMEENNQ